MTTIRNAFLAGLACCQALSVAGMSAGANEFQPHRAVYELSLDRVEDGSGISAVSGKMVYEFRGSACEGYTVDVRLITDITATNGASRLTDVRTTRFEAGDASGFQFFTRAFQDQKLAQESRGVASREDEKLLVSVKKPAEKDLTFDGGILFPSQHFIEIIRQAQAGEQFYSVDVYDGSQEGDSYFESTAVIGKPREIAIPEAEPANISKKYWPIVISYYDPRKNRTDSTPVYTLSFLSNVLGIFRDMKMDYNSFVIDGKLSDLTIFPIQSCQ